MKDIQEINIQEHLKITVNEKTMIKNSKTQTISENITTKVIMNNRVK
jgi:hypothetical protein